MMSGRIDFHHVIAKTQSLQHAGRKSLGHDIADPHQVFGDLQSFRMADVQRNAALAGVLVVELPAHVEVFHPRQRPGRRIARRASADRRHRGEPRVRIVLPLDLVTFRPHRREKPRPARRRQEPREIQDLHALQRKRLAVQRRLVTCRSYGFRLRRHERPPRGFARTVSVSSPTSGARRPTFQLVLVASHLLVG